MKEFRNKVLFLTDVNNGRVNLIVRKGKSNAGRDKRKKNGVEEKVNNICIDKVAFFQILFDDLRVYDGQLKTR